MLSQVYLQVHSPKDLFVLEVMDYQHNSKDRSLGIADFLVTNLIAEGTDKVHKPWVGTGKITKTERLKSDGRKTVKGDLEYEAEFFPCVHLNEVSFTPADQVKTVNKSIAEESSEGSTPATQSVENLSGTVGAGDTTPKTSSFVSLPGTPKSTADSAAASVQTGTNGTTKTQESAAGVSMTREELLKTQTGVLAFQVISGQLAKKGARLEVLFDDG